MNENLPTSVQLDASGNGTVVFATDVIATIAGLAATEVEGVTCMSGAAAGNSLADIFSRKNQGSKNMTKGVRVELGEDKTVSIGLTIVVDYGSPIPEVAGNIQENVKKAIETMSGLTVSSVNVHVSGVSFEREQRSAAEIEMKQRLMLQKQEEERAQSGAANSDEPKSEPEKPVESEKPAEPEKPVEPEQPAPSEQPEADESEDDDEFVLDLGDEPEDEEPENAESDNADGEKA